MTQAYKFRNHRLVDHPFNPARWTGGKISPKLIVIHDTAGRLEKGNAARYLQKNDAKVSIHFVVERDGTVVQQVATNRRANHAGRSSYHGMKGCNDFSIGIELVSVGRMQRNSKFSAITWFKQTHLITSDILGGDGAGQVAASLDIEEACPILEVATPEHGHGLWMDYTVAQIDACSELCKALFAYVPTLTDIRGHWYVSPGRKVDPNPLFPMEQLRSLVLGRREPEVVGDLEIYPNGDQLVTIETPGDTLNMRRWPSYNPNVIAQIPDGTVLPVLRSGLFDGEEWHLVRYGGQEGWINARYAAATAIAEATS